MLKKLHWLPVEPCSVFKTCLQVSSNWFYRVLLHISLRTAVYSTRRSQSGSNLFVIPKFQPAIRKSVKQFGYSFAFDAPTVRNALPDEICASPPSLFQKAAQNLSVHQDIPTLVLPHGILCGAWSFFCHRILESVNYFVFCALKFPLNRGD